jgi:signal transduction histidine kinase
MTRRRADAFSQVTFPKIKESEYSSKNEEFSSDVLMSLHQTIVLMIDSSGNQIAFWGQPDLDELYGIRSLGSELIIANVLSSEDISRWETHINTVFVAGESIRGEYPLYLPQGEFWFDMAFSPVWGPKGKVSAVIVIIRDITSLQEKMNELLNMYQDLQLYTSLLRHYLSNDVQVILSETKVSEIKGSNETDLTKMIDVIKASAERMVRVLNAFEVGEKVDGNEIVHILQKAALQAESVHQNLRIVLKFTPNTRKAKVSGGRLLPTVFDNLFRNVAQHAGENPQVRIIISTVGRNCQIDIIDNGPGIPQELLKDIFQRRNGRSGLSLCRRIIEGCGGAILLMDKQNIGAAFRIKLPLVR